MITKYIKFKYQKTPQDISYREGFLLRGTTDNITLLESSNGIEDMDSVQKELDAIVKNFNKEIELFCKSHDLKFKYFKEEKITYT